MALHDLPHMGRGPSRNLAAGGGFPGRSPAERRAEGVDPHAARNTKCPLHRPSGAGLPVQTGHVQKEELEEELDEAVERSLKSLLSKSN